MTFCITKASRNLITLHMSVYLFVCILFVFFLSYKDFNKHLRYEARPVIMVPLLFLLLSHGLIFVKATSFKMDFLSAGTVRTDPLMFSTIGNCVRETQKRNQQNFFWKIFALSSFQYLSIIFSNTPL